jgi:hypothetical protein
VGLIPFFLEEVTHDSRIEGLGFSLAIETDEKRTMAVRMAGFDGESGARAADPPVRRLRNSSHGPGSP